MICPRFAFSALCALTFAATAAQANPLDDIKDNAGGAAGQKAGLLQKLSSGSLDLGNAKNAAGILGYCQDQGYTEGATNNIKNKLMDKVGGQSEAEESNDYQQGLKGMLQGDEGENFNLSSLKDKVGEKACSTIADKVTSSFLGG